MPSTANSIHTLKGYIFNLHASIVSVHLPSQTPFSATYLLSCDSKKDPDPAFQKNADPSGSATLVIVRCSVVDPGCLSRIRIFSILDPGSTIHIKELKYFNPKKLFLSSRKYDPGCSSRILPIPDPGSKGQKGTGARIRIRNTVTLVDRIFCLPCPCSTHCADATEAMREYRDGERAALRPAL